MRRRFFKIILWTCLLSLVLTGMASAVEGTVIDASLLKVRSSASTNAEILGKISEGKTVNVTGMVGDWYIIDYKGETAFVFAEYVELGEVKISGLGVIDGKSVNVRSGPSTEHKVLDRLLDGTMVKIIGMKDGWYEVKFTSLVGYVHPDYLYVESLTFSEPGAPDAEPAAVKPAYTPSDYVSSTRKQVIEYAYKYLGTPYVYGGSSPEGFDCSGFTQYVFKNNGFTISRTASAQINNGTRITRAELKPGDLVFFTRGSYTVGHVGIYVGDDYFIHATSPGDVVRVSSMSSGYYNNNYVGATRIIND